MNKLIFLAALLANCVQAAWEPVFVDNFDTKKLSRAHWVTGQENLPRQLQRYDSKAIKIRDGKLILSNGHASNSTRPFFSGALTSQGLFAQRYGYFEVRAKLPAGNGYWPAFWLMPVSGQWTSEIDIFEYIGNNNSLHHAMHYDWRAQNSNGKTIKPKQHLGQGFNTFALHWSPQHIRYLLNGKVTHEITRADVIAKAKDPMYLMLNTAIASQHTGWIKGADASTLLGQLFEIDYVRVYRQSDSGRFANIPPATAKLADVAPSPYDNVAVSIDLIDDAQSTPAIIRAPTPIKATLALTAHKAMKTALWVSLHKVKKFEKDGRMLSDKIKVLSPKLHFKAAGERQTLDIDFSEIGPLSPGYYFVDVVVRDNPKRHSNRSAARILAYQYPDRDEAIYWDAFIRSALAHRNGNTLQIKADIQLQEAMLTKHLVLHYRLTDPGTGRTVLLHRANYRHNSIGRQLVIQQIPLPPGSAQDLNIEIFVSDAANKNRSEPFTIKLSQQSPPQTVELTFDESR